MINMRTYEPVDEDTWSMDYSLAIFLDKAFTKFIECSQAHPTELTEQEWDAILKEIRDGFRTYHRYKDWDWSLKGEEIAWEEVENQLIRSFYLMGKYYSGLWW